MMSFVPWTRPRRLQALDSAALVALLAGGDKAGDAAALDAYVAAYQDHAEALYQSYFARYAGQSLRVIASRERAPGDFIVTTTITGKGSEPMEVDFRVKTDGTRPLLLDIGIAGVWLAPAQQAEFLAVLSQNNGDINALSAHLRTAQAR